MAVRIDNGRGPYQKTGQKPAKTGGLQRSKGLRASSALKRREASVRAKKRVKPLPKRNEKRKPKITGPEWCHLQAVLALPCVIDGMRSPYVEAHHCFHDRATKYEGRKSGHFDTIPLHDRWHQGKWHSDGLPIHGNKKTWRKLYGADHGYVRHVHAQIYGNPEPTDEEIAAHWANHPWMEEFQRRNRNA